MVFSRLSELFENIPHADVFCYAVEEKKGYSFHYCDDLNYFIEQYSTLEMKNHNEIFREGRPLKLFFDIDISKQDRLDLYKQTGLLKHFSLDTAEIVNELRRCITEFHVQMLKKTYILHTLMVLDSSEVNGKRSLHVMDHANHFKDPASMKIYYNGLRDFVKDNDDYTYMKYIDFGICSKNRLMRMIGSSKIEDPNRVLKPSRFTHRPHECGLSSKWFATHVDKHSTLIRMKKEAVVLKPPRPSLNDVDQKDMLKSCKGLIQDLNPETAVKRKDWYAIGSALHKCLDGSNDAFKLWIKFSKSNPESYCYDECVTEWNRGMCDKYNYSTLCYYSHRDSN